VEVNRKIDGPLNRKIDPVGKEPITIQNHHKKPRRECCKYTCRTRLASFY